VSDPGRAERAARLRALGITRDWRIAIDRAPRTGLYSWQLYAPGADAPAMAHGGFRSARAASEDWQSMRADVRRAPVQ
jgi:hypothetical protein